jgi:energy-coupling factor transport system permease protein
MSNITASAKSMVAYTDSDAVMWQIDPRVKLLWITVTIVLSVLFRAPIPVLLLCVQTLVISMFWGYPVFDQVKRHKGTFFFLIVVVGLLNLLFAGFIEGKIILTLNLILFRINFTDAGILYTITVTLRLITIFFAILILTTTTKMANLTRALEKMGLPYQFCFLFSLTWRLIPCIAEGLDVTIDAQRTRGVEMDSGTLKQKLAAIQRIIKPTFLLLGSLINDMTLAFISKGVDLKAKNRTSIWQPKLRINDYILLGHTAIWMIAGIVCKLYGLFSL